MNYTESNGLKIKKKRECRGKQWNVAKMQEGPKQPRENVLCPERSWQEPQPVPTLLDKGSPAEMAAACHQQTNSHPLWSLGPGLGSITTHSVCKCFHQDVLKQMKSVLEKSPALCHRCRQGPSHTATLPTAGRCSQNWASTGAVYGGHWPW